MFCYQCEQTAKGTGCTLAGVCGKDARTAALQDLLVHAAKGVAMYAHRAREAGARDREIDRFVVEALFSTVTNVNFDPERLAGLLKRAAAVRDRARKLYEGTCSCSSSGRKVEILDGPAVWEPAKDTDGFVKQGESLGVEAMLKSAGRKKET